jgi:hypothetical protein
MTLLPLKYRSSAKSPVPKSRQTTFSFVSRAQRLERMFKRAILGFTICSIAFFLTAFSPGRYLSGWLASRGAGLARAAFGLPPDRDAIDADWQRKRTFDVEQSERSLPGTFAEYPPEMKRVLQFAGLDPAHALVRWGNFDRTVLLPSPIFEADNTGRSYRFRPNVRSIWIRNFPVKGPVKAYFQVLDTPEVPEIIKGTGAQIVEGSVQTTNSWALRGPEPDLHAGWRGIVLGDSYMQGLFVGDHETPVECLKRDLTSRLREPVEILNTGHLGYSPEQYYFTLIEYARRFTPHFVVTSVFANDFGDFHDVLEGRGDWEEGAYWLAKIRAYCFARQIDYVLVVAPWVNQIEGPERPGNYPGKLSNAIEVPGQFFLNPIADFANALLEHRNKAKASGLTPVSGPNPFFNGHVGDGHFSAKGAEVWAKAVGKRVALLVERRLYASARFNTSAKVVERVDRSKTPRVTATGPTLRSP